MAKQLRIDFPDYPAAEQERDAKRTEQLKKTDVYVSRVDGVWNAIIPKKYNITINGLKGETLVTFVQNVSEDLAQFGIKPHYRCVRNEGIEAHFRHNQAILRGFNNGRD